MYLQPPRSARKQCVALDTYCTYLLSSLGNIKGLWFPYRPLKCWPEINRLPDIFSSKDGSLRTSREFQFEVWNHGQSPSSLCTAREGECFYRGGKGRWEGYGKQRFHSFSLAESLTGRKRSLSSSSWALLSGHEKSPSNLPVLFHCGLCLLIFYCFNRLFNILENQILAVLHSMGSLCEIYCNSTELPLALRDWAFD